MKNKRNNISRLNWNIIARLNSTNNLNSAIKLIIRYLLELEEVDFASIFKYDIRKKIYYLLGSSLISKNYLEYFQQVPDDTPEVKLFNSLKPSYYRKEELTDYPNLKNMLDDIKILGLIPFIFKDDVVAVVTVVSNTQDEFSLRTKEIIESLCSAIGGLIHRLDIESQLKSSQINFKKVFDMSPTLMSLISFNDHRIIDVNDNWLKFYGFKKEEVIGKPISMLNIVDEDTRLGIFNELKKGVSVRNVEVELSTKTNEVRTGLVSAEKIELQNQMCSLVNITDVTERKIIQNKIEAQLLEKELLIHEIQHRVKNNLQIITSLIDLQHQLSEDPKVKGALQDTRNRIKAFTLVFDKIYQANNLYEIHIKNYIDRLVKSLFLTYDSNNTSIKIEVNADEMKIPIDNLVNLGIILAELISNSLKYAFPNGREGKIIINVKTIDNSNDVEINVIDDGIGIPDDRNLFNNGTLGLRIVIMMIQELNGQVNYDTSKGTAIYFTLPEFVL